MPEPLDLEALRRKLIAHFRIADSIGRSWDHECYACSPAEWSAILAALERIPELEAQRHTFDVGRQREADRADRAEVEVSRLRSDVVGLQAIIDLHDSSAHCVARERELADVKARAERVEAAARELCDAIVFEASPTLRLAQVRAEWFRPMADARERLRAALADASEGSDGE